MSAAGAILTVMAITKLSALGEPIKDIIARAMTISSLSDTDMLVLHYLHKQVDKAEERYRRVLDTPVGQRAFAAYLMDLVDQVRAVVSRYGNDPGRVN